MTKMHSSFMKGFSESYLADLGRVIAGWSHVEAQFDTLFLSVIVMQGASSGSMSDPRVKMLGMSFERRVRAFRKRIREIHPACSAARDTVERALDQLTALRKERDDLAHSILSPVMQVGQTLDTTIANAVIKSWRNEKKHEFKTIKQKHIKKLFQRTEELFWSLIQLALQTNLWRQPLPET